MNREDETKLMLLAGMLVSIGYSWRLRKKYRDLWLKADSIIRSQDYQIDALVEFNKKVADGKPEEALAEYNEKAEFFLIMKKNHL